MEKEFVTYEIALKLKELGFNEICCARYDAVGDSVFFQQHVLVETQQDFSWQLCSAPLWQQVIDWFREEHNIYIDISGRLIDSEDKTFQWNVYGLFVEIPGELYSGLDKDFNMARIQSTERAIELVK